MKVFKRSLFILLTTLLIAAFAVVGTACNKQEKYTLTLDPDGGTLSTTSLELAEGENIYDAVKDLIPQKEGLTFGAWFVEEVELAASRLMPASPLTLKAKYKVGYAAEVYLQSGAQYVLSPENAFSGSDYVGASVTVDAPAIAGYSYRASHTNGVRTLTLSETVSENVFKLYYVADAAARITYNANAPAGTTASGSVEDTLAGEDGTAIVAQNSFTVAGYRFAGWSTSQDGSVRYAAGDTITLANSLTLYAVWDMGYPDRFGSSDMVYLPQTEAGVAILARGAAEFRGAIEGNDFTFERADGEVLHGRIFADTHTFALANEALAGTYYNLRSYFDPDDDAGANALSRSEALVIDEYGSATHYADMGTSYEVSESGIVIYSAETDEYLFLVTTGENAGNGFVFKLGSYTGEGGDLPVFMTTNGEGGLYYEFLTGDGISGSYGDATIYLDGYGTIYFYDNIFRGVYWLEEVYSNGTDYYIYKINAILEDVNNQARDVLGYDVVDGFFSFTFYTLPLSETDYAYVMPKAEAGEFASNGEGVLVLDGFRMFPDSAQYTDAEGNFYRGSYNVYATPKNELLVFVAVVDDNGLPTGREFTFRLFAQDGDVVFTADEESASTVEYILLEDGAFSYRLVLAIYEEEYAGIAGSRRASLLVELTSGQSDYLEASVGYVTEQPLTGASASMFVYHETERKAAGGFNVEVPVEFGCMLASAFDNSYFNRSLYFVFYYIYERAGVREEVKNYTVVADANGGSGEIWYMDVGVSSIGSIYYDSYGDAYVGGLIVDTTSYYFGDVGTFIWVNPRTGAAEYFYFDLEMGSNGQPATFTRIDGLEYPVYTIAADGSVDGGTVQLIVRGNEAMYSPSGSFAEDTVRGTFTSSGRTAAGDEIVQLINRDGVVVLSVVLDYISYLDYGYGYVDIWVYYTYRPAADGIFTSDGKGTLLVDGYRSAIYTDENGRPVTGTFALSSDGKVVTFTSESGENLLFGVEGERFRILDGVYGSYNLHYLGEWFTISLDGQGNVTVWQGTVVMGDGLYNVLDVATMQLRLFLDLGDGIETVTVALGYDGFAPVDDLTQGVFVSSDWSVLELDGYGTGTYYAWGSAGVTVYYDVISAEDGYISLLDENFNYCVFLLDDEHHSFTVPVTLGERHTYYAEDFSALAFSVNGEVSYRNAAGYYRVLGSTVRLYLPEGDTGYYYPLDLGLPTDGNYEVEGKTYYLWTGAGVTFTGTIELNEGGDNYSADATLTFTPSGDVQFYVSGVFTVDGQAYSVTVVNQYWDYRTGVYRGLALYDEAIYEYSPFTEYSFVPGGVSTFKVRGGRVETTMYDGFEEEVESYLTEHYIGFGPIRRSETYVSGMVYVDGVVLTIGEAKVEAVLNNSADMGNRYMAVFESGGEQYAIFYYKFDGDYWLYMIATYETLHTDGYTVGVARYYSSNDGFTFPASVRRGTPFGIALFDETGAVITAYNTYFNGDGTSAWLLALGSYNASTGAGEVGSIYSIEFARTDDVFTGVTVTEYALKQATGNSGSVFFFANFFVNEEGDVVGPASIAVNGGDGYEFLSFTSVEQVSENVWVFHGTDGYDYRMTLIVNEDGEYEEDETGEYWVITLVSSARA